MIRIEQQIERARPFAEALLELAEASGQADAVQADLDSIAELVGLDHDFAELLDSPLIAPAAKGGSVQRIFAGRVTELTGRFLRALAEHDALSLLRVLGEQFRLERDDRLGRIHAEATTASPLDEAAQVVLKGKLSAALAAEVMLHCRVDAAVLGGMVLRIGDTLFDGSVRRRLEEFRRQVIARGYHEIQSGRDLVAD